MISIERMFTQGRLTGQLGVMICICALALLACSGFSASKDQTDTNTNAMEAVPIQRLEKGSHAFVQGAQMHFQIFEDGDAFSAAYAQIHSGTLPRPKPPAVDFQRWLVVGAFLGQRPTAGYGIDLGPAETLSGPGMKHLEINVNVSGPPADSMTAQVVTSPYTLILVPRSQWRSVQFFDQNRRLLADIAVVER